MVLEKNSGGEKNNKNIKIANTLSIYYIIYFLSILHVLINFILTTHSIL